MSQGQPEIVKTEIEQQFGLFHWYIFGLNILNYNDVPCPIEQRPDVRFLTDFTIRLPCSAHVDALALRDRVDAPEEIFGSPEGTTPYLPTRVSYHDGFYDLDTWPYFDACFFPQVTTRFWEDMLREEDNLEQMLLNYGLAFYVGATPAALNAMHGLLAQPFPGQERWLVEVTTLYPLVVTVGHDGQFFHAYAQNETDFHLLEPSLAVAEEAVKSSVWFQDHRDRLAWDDGLDACLMLQK